MKIQTITSTALFLIFSSGALAKVSQEQANKLGSELTPMGAQVAANTTGSIPSYTGGLSADINADPFVDVFSQEKPLFTITAENVANYQDNLSDGQKALFKKYPDTYKMPIYKSHRTAAYPQETYAKAKKNAVTTELVDGGTGLSQFDETVPFAIPQNGLEVIWNHVSRFRGGSVERNTAQVTVQRDGNFTPIKTRSNFTMPQYLQDGFDKNSDDNILFYYVSKVKSPARFTGNVFLVHETIDQIKQPRMAWTYNSGQRRVRRAPQVAYDAPAQASEGLKTTDQIDMFNGAPDRYDWNLVGKKEIYIPYNSYKLADKNVKYKDIVKAGHINQDYSRYELHRVWQVEATLKEDARHIYSKRTFYVDEDSWQIALADHYDNRNQLWRSAEGHSLQFVNANAPWYASITYYDLMSGRYAVELNNEERDAFKFRNKITRKSFTAAAIRRMGKR
ncbi:MAG: DUF1329 domain-containing protein [Bermanella sp.]